jgi:hypothetical protein
MLRTSVSIVIALLMSGCGLIPRTGTPSEALTIADAMSVPATDLPKAQYTEMIARRNGAGDGRNLDNTVAGAAQMMASGNPAMLLLSGFTPRCISANIQFVAWVPEDVASSPEEAVNISSKTYIEASANAQARNEEERQKLLGNKVRYILGQPYGEGSRVHAYVQLFDLVADHSPNLVDAPAFMNTRHEVYGPIFIGAWGGHAKTEDVQMTLKMSEQLPAWFYIYSPGLAGVVPRSIMNQGKQHLFVEP